VLLVSARPRLKWFLFGLVGCLAVALDLLSKRVAQASLDPGERIELLSFLSLQRTSNRGVAFGLLSGRTSLIIAAAAVALVVVVLYFLLEPRPVLGGLAGGLLLGGALGNLVERVSVGSVTDFIKVPNYPTFNLADIFIVAGVALVAASVLFGPPKQEAEERPS
jgi:signal peptidase II